MDGAVDQLSGDGFAHIKDAAAGHQNMYPFRLATNHMSPSVSPHLQGAEWHSVQPTAQTRYLTSQEPSLEFENASFVGSPPSAHSMSMAASPEITQSPLDSNFMQSTREYAQPSYQFGPRPNFMNPFSQEQLQHAAYHNAHMGHHGSAAGSFASTAWAHQHAQSLPQAHSIEWQQMQHEMRMRAQYGQRSEPAVLPSGYDHAAYGAAVQAPAPSAYVSHQRQQRQVQTPDSTAESSHEAILQARQAAHEQMRQYMAQRQPETAQSRQPATRPTPIRAKSSQSQVQRKAQAPSKQQAAAESVERAVNASRENSTSDWEVIPKQSPGASIGGFSESDREGSYEAAASISKRGSDDKGKKRKESSATGMSGSERRALNLQRNREAAARCRKKRKGADQKQSEDCQVMEAQNKALKTERDSLRAALTELRTSIIARADEGCADERLMAYLADSAMPKQAERLRKLMRDWDACKGKERRLMDDDDDSDMEDDE